MRGRTRGQPERPMRAKGGRGKLDERADGRTRTKSDINQLVQFFLGLCCRRFACRGQREGCQLLSGRRRGSAGSPQQLQRKSFVPMERTRRPLDCILAVTISSVRTSERHGRNRARIQEKREVSVQKEAKASVCKGATRLGPAVAETPPRRGQRGRDMTTATANLGPGRLRVAISPLLE